MVEQQQPLTEIFEHLRALSGETNFIMTASHLASNGNVGIGDIHAYNVEHSAKMRIFAYYDEHQ